MGDGGKHPWKGYSASAVVGLRGGGGSELDISVNRGLLGELVSVGGESGD